MESLSLSCVVPGPPQPKERPRVARGGAYTPSRTSAYEWRVLCAAKVARPRRWPMDARYRVSIVAHFADRRRRDLDNVAKAVLDGLNDVVWGDDSQVDDMRIVRALDRANPRAEITVEVIS